ncbi:MAG: nucleotide sugar dehydrogenase, partial [Oscillospiraceae bacterium]|nr:nucleotide sugar dehydrogenase [Oscillospiraceae bacterium]
TGELIVVIKSTVPVGTSGAVKAVIAQRLAERAETHTFRMVSNPEFLKEGTAVNDCLRPDRVILGVSDEESAEVMTSLYAPFMKNSYRAVIMDIPSAEMTKYAANAMLALRISFMNELSSVCEAVGADINNVRIGIGSDGRIGYKFLYAGCGYGGSCFPKDVRALIVTAKENGCTADILEAAEGVNERQKLVLVNKIIKKFGEDLSGHRFAVWGIAFKPDTDDTRYAPSLSIIAELTKRGAVVTAYDPLVKVLPEQNDAVTVASDKYKALEGADALILVTEWKAFRSPDFDEIKAKLKTPVIFDGRNQYDAAALRGAGFYYEQIGRQS